MKAARLVSPRPPPEANAWVLEASRVRDFTYNTKATFWALEGCGEVAWADRWCVHTGKFSLSSRVHERSPYAHVLSCSKLSEYSIDISVALFENVHTTSDRSEFLGRGGEGTDTDPIRPDCVEAFCRRGGGGHE